MSIPAFSNACPKTLNVLSSASLILFFRIASFQSFSKPAIICLDLDMFLFISFNSCVFFSIFLCASSRLDPFASIKLQICKINVPIFSGEKLPSSTTILFRTRKTRLILFWSKAILFSALEKARFEATRQIGMLFLLHITAISCWIIRVLSCFRDSCKNSLTAPSLMSNSAVTCSCENPSSYFLKIWIFSHSLSWLIIKFLKREYKYMVSGCDIEP